MTNFCMNKLSRDIQSYSEESVWMKKIEELLKIEKLTKETNAGYYDYF